MVIRRLIAALRRLNQREQGLTAIELAVVVAILAVLAGLVASSTTGMSTAARGTSRDTDVAEIQKAIDNYVGQHPKSLYPVQTEVAICTSGSVISGTTVTTSTATLSALATTLGSNCAAIDFDATYTTNDEPPVTKKLVPDFVQRDPKHAADNDSGGPASSWLIDQYGKVSNRLANDQY